MIGFATLGLTTALRRTTASWWPADAVLDADFLNARYFYANGEHASEAAWLAAIGGAKSGTAFTFGPYIAADAPNLIDNGDFSDGATGWATHNSGLFSVISGEGVLEANGATSPGFSRPFPSQPGRAYRLTGTYRRGTVSGGCGLILGPNANANGGATSVSNGSVNPVTNMVLFGAESATTYAGGRCFTTGVTGTTIFDDLAVQAAMPFAGFEPNGFSIKIAATTPDAVGTGDKVLFQADHGAAQSSDNTARNRVRLVWASDAHLKLRVDVAASAQAALDLGAVPAATAFEVALSIGASAVRAAIVGRPVQVKTAISMPGIGVIRLGRSYAGETWDGAIGRISLYAAPKTELDFAQLSGGSGAVVAWGDSLTAGANASADAYRYPQAAQSLFSPPRGIVNLGIGGQLSTEIAARQGALPIGLTLSNNLIPASGAASVTARSIAGISGVGPLTAQGTQTITGTLAGIAGTLARDAADLYTFTRTLAGDAIACPPGSVFVPDYPSRLGERIQWFWVGRNGAVTGRTVEADIAAMVASLGHDHYLVGAILTSASDNATGIAQIQARNATLAASYGTRFVDLYAILRDNSDGGAEDAEDIAAGLIPRSLRSDAVHLNDAGYAIVAAAMVAATNTMGW